MAKFNLSTPSSLLFQLSRSRHTPRLSPIPSQARNYQHTRSPYQVNPPSMQAATRSTANACRNMAKNQLRPYTNGSHAPSTPRHLLSIADLTPTEFATLVRNAYAHKQAIKSDAMPERLLGSLSGKTVAMLFSKRSTRTRVSTEGAVVKMGGHPMFLGKDDIQLGVNESLYDTSVVISSMVSCIVARVGPHSDIANLAKDSSVPVINALCDTFHPLQAIADFLTIHETFASPSIANRTHSSSLGLEGLKIAWVGDANNVLYDLAIAATKMGVNISVATPKGYEMPSQILELVQKAREGVQSPGNLTQTTVPEEAVKNADVIVTDTWISMGQESEKVKRLEAFKGFQVTSDLAKRGGAKEHWKFMHCLPRHPEEVSDEVFYGERSLVFPEAENRLWAAISALEGFVVNKGKIA
ncbi:ornithine carbamoyltransferase [Uncinocarpus reesii 1704]|uniref:Ornithine carbamoyltransferase, mitochondrial n=1 Tax=Uncinocarpus reesii (strain UAMH 1704) TaxID=336963 RepID=C4JW52_UNCRE|nr:ornithine carbamoyltransferase [Uncinocarpus reesii 1704]EEP81929.1 ornithine carbamoyltransferase [Uncinocarpus reesii 1704]